MDDLGGARYQCNYWRSPPQRSHEEEERRIPAMLFSIGSSDRTGLDCMSYMLHCFSLELGLVLCWIPFRTDMSHIVLGNEKNLAGSSEVDRARRFSFHVWMWRIDRWVVVARFGSKPKAACSHEGIHVLSYRSEKRTAAGHGTFLKVPDSIIWEQVTKNEHLLPCFLLQKNNVK